MQDNLITMFERLGSLGLLGWLLVWATGTAWPKLSSHLDIVSGKLDRIGDQLTGLREDIAELRALTVGARRASPESRLAARTVGDARIAPARGGQ